MDRSRTAPPRNSSLLRHARGAVLAAIVIASLGSAHAQTYVKNHKDVPLWNQHRDYRTTTDDVLYGYDGISSLIPVAGGNNGTGPFVTYDNLAADGRAKFIPPANATYSLAGAGAVWAANDYYNANPPAALINNIAAGNWHCVAAAVAMVYEWVRQHALTKLVGYGNEARSINQWGYLADVNQRRTSSGDGLGKLGTDRRKMINAANEYLRVYYTGWFPPEASIWNYTEKAYKKMIKADNPIVLAYESLNAQGQPTGSGHVVVGVGFDDNNVIVRDSWDAREKKHRFNRIRQLDDGLGINTQFGSADPPSASFDAEWTRARLQVINVPDFGDAQSSYEPDPSNRANHQSGDREWLGAQVSGEVDPMDPVDDPDGEANITAGDHFDDGIVFLAFNPAQVQIQATVSSVSGMSLDSAFEADAPPTLHLNGWIDWNRNFVWEEAERVVDWSGAADFDGSMVLNFNTAMPGGFLGQTWARFRLDRGEDVGPLGPARFGEVEDYLVSYTAQPACQDGIRDFSETDINCGGGSCPACVVDAHCTVGSDCASGGCNPDTHQCCPVSGSCPLGGGVSISFVNRTTFSWAPMIGADGYDVVRGALAELPVGGGVSETCMADGSTLTQATDTLTPPLGSGYWYLVRGENCCGPGTYGQATNGTEISGACSP